MCRRRRQVELSAVPVKSSQATFARRSLTNLIGQWLTIAATFVVGVVIARVGGVDGKGLHAAFLIASTAILLVANFGVSRAAIYYSNEGSFPLRDLINQVWTLNWILGPIALLVVVFGSTVVSVPSLDAAGRPAVVVLGLSAPALLMRLSASNLYAASSDFVRLNMTMLAAQLASLIGVLLLFSSVAKPLAASGAIAAMAYGGALAGWAGIVRLKGWPRLVWDWHVVKKLISYGLRAYSQAIGSFLSLRVDQLFVGALIGIEALGVYSVAVALSELSGRFTRAIAMVLFPEVSRSDSQAATLLTLRVTRILNLGAAGFAVLLVILARPTIEIIFGSQFVTAYQPLIWLIPGIFAANLFDVLSNDLAGRGKPEIGSLATLLGVFVAIVGNVLLAERFGLVAVAGVASVGYIASASVVVAYFARVTSTPISSVLLPRVEDLASIRNMVLSARPSKE